MKNILLIIKEFVDKFIDSFKMKNPTAFTVVAGLLYSIWWTLNDLLMNGLIKDVVLNIPIVGEVLVLDTVLKVLVFILTLAGTHTPATKPPIINQASLPTYTEEP